MHPAVQAGGDRLALDLPHGGVVEAAAAALGLLLEGDQHLLHEPARPALHLERLLVDLGSDEGGPRRRRGRHCGHTSTT